KNNWTIHEAAPATGLPAPQNTLIKQAQPAAPAFLPPNVTNSAYTVIPFPYESPNHTAVATDNEPWLKANPYNANAITHGWHYDGTTNYTITRGNNVFAYLD